MLTKKMKDTIYEFIVSQEVEETSFCNKDNNSDLWYCSNERLEFILQCNQAISLIQEHTFLSLVDDNVNCEEMKNITDKEVVKYIQESFME